MARQRDSRRGPIVVVGSINMDLVARAPRLPGPGETVIGTEFSTIPGGKGANQAVAAARLGGEVHFVGRVGDDAFGGRLLAGLEWNGVRTAAVAVTRGVPSGVALILVDQRGENSIVVAPGANGLLSPRDVSARESLIRRASVVLLQLEIPLETVARTLIICRRHGVPAILDPAPVPPGGLPAALHRVDVLTPNETEAAALLGIPMRKARPTAKSSGRIAARLLSRGAKSVVLKLGSRGSLFLGPSGPPVSARAFPVRAVDTTAAGDAFTGALAVAMREGMSVGESLRFANAAGALACTVRGAQPALPSRGAVERLRRGRKG